MAYIVGAYAAAPPAGSDPVAVAAFLDGAAALPGFRGFELPYIGDSDSFSSSTPANVDPSWDLVVTAIPGTVGRTAADPSFGLASTAPAGRAAALRFTDGLRSAVLGLNDRAGRRAVIAVELHSAPTGYADRSAFRASLESIAGWDWDGAALTVEHCDAARPGQPAQKGYLPLADEIDAVAGLPGFAGVTVNWGRSAIEGRSAATAIEHIDQARSRGLLAGVMLSGASDRDGTFGAAWSDAHLPPSAAADGEPGLASEQTSLLGPAEIADSLQHAGGEQLFTGLKIGVRPVDLPLDARIAYLRNTIRLIDGAT